jgi:hypothetical protein
MIAIVAGSSRGSIANDVVRELAVDVVDENELEVEILFLCYQGKV